jgi:serine protease Do
MRRFPVYSGIILIFLFVACFAVGVRAENLADLQNALAKVAEKAFPAIVTVKAMKKDNTFSAAPEIFEEFMDFHFPPSRNGFSIDVPGYTSAYGSGFLISEDGQILTSCHILKGASYITVFFSDDQPLKAQIIGIDPMTGIALLKTDIHEKLPYLSLADSSKVKPGHIAIAIATNSFHNTMTFGIVSRVGTLGQTKRKCILSDVLTDSKNIGGPLLDINGNVMGLNSIIEINTPNPLFNTALCYSIPSNSVKEALDRIKDETAKPGKIENSRNKTIIYTLSGYGIELGEKNGSVYIVGIKSNSPAEFAPLRGGMRIQSINRLQIHTIEEARKAAEKYRNRLYLYIDDDDARHFIVLTK